MGARGPRPIPTAILQMQGSRIQGRRGEPRLEPKAPPCPRWLTKEERTVWRWAVRELLGMRVLTTADRAALARYCQLTIQAQNLQAFLAKCKAGIYTYPVKKLKQTGPTEYEEVVTGYKEFPQFAEYLAIHDRLLKMEQEFGFTAAARARLQVISEQERPKVAVRPRGKVG